ncbi:XdhC family protein [Rhizobium leguminosarum]|nr:XdhC family protein [Rhizobium leguminosarum]
MIRPTPVRVLRSDCPEDILQFAKEAYRDGNVALATLTEIRGGAARSLGSQMVIAGDGRFCGYVSGGCVEAAVTAEALVAIEQREDRTTRYGDGSPFFDIVLPCGGGITVAIHVVRDISVIDRVLQKLERREETSLCYRPDTQSISDAGGSRSNGWEAGAFYTIYRPKTRLVTSGNALESEAVADVSRAAGYEVMSHQERKSSDDPELPIDRYTAIVLLHHDLDREEALLRLAMNSDAFYIGALGSTRTHRKRVLRLQLYASGEAISRVKAPIGIFGPTRDATSLALSIVADVAASRLALYG